MKKKTCIVIVLAALAIGTIAYFPSKAALSKKDFMSQWGKKLSDNTREENYKGKDYKVSTIGEVAECKVSENDVYMEGSDILITKEEIDTAKTFYILQGMDDKEAEEAAIEYMKEFNAMYIEAVQNGFDVTEDEVENYIEQLKITIRDAENSDEIEKVISQFDSEEEYWEYQKLVYKKQLPIQKYVQNLEEEYNINHEREESIDNNTNLWNEELDNIKEKVTKKQEYRKIGIFNRINKKFKDE